MTVSQDNQPPIAGLIFGWERGLDPWHADGFPSDLRDYAPHQGTIRAEGWFGLDWCGNEIIFVQDGATWEEGQA